LIAESKAGTVVLAAPYPEGAIIQLGRRPEAFRGELETFLPSRSLSLAATRLAGRSGKLGGRLSRGSENVAGLRPISPLLEPIRLVGRVPGVRRLFPANMALLKRLFDEAVARRLREDVSSLIGMPGGCLRSFEQSSVKQRVFHAVDGHPAALNGLLEMHYGRAAQREYVPAVQVERIVRELALADIVLAPSDVVKAQMVAEGVSADRVRVVPYGVNFGLFAPGRSVRANDRPHLLYVGQISYRKGIPFLLEAVRGQNVSLLMIGPVVAPELLENLPTNVEYRGAVGHDELPRYFAKSDALVVPSIEDAFALVIAEALGAGVPVVTTSATGASSLLVNVEDGAIVLPGDVNALRTALSGLTPLGPGDREERARRHRGQGSGLTSWSGYASAVALAIGEAA
jgi:glycosyltransferase involved in cell wall biosynthesis